MSPPHKGCFVYRGAFFACGLRGARTAVAQPFATKERYGCGVPLAGIAGTISCRNASYKRSYSSLLSHLPQGRRSFLPNHSLFPSGLPRTMSKENPGKTIFPLDNRKLLCYSI